MAEPLGLATRELLWRQEDPLLQECHSVCEVSRQRFRRFRYAAAARPQEAFSRLWELCSQWLKPQVRPVQQILELLVLEQFLDILPSDIESRLTAHGPEDRGRLFALIEDLQRDRGRPEYQLDRQDMLLEELMPLGRLLTPSDSHLESPPILQVLEPDQEPLGMPQAEVESSKCGGAVQCPPFLDFGPGSFWTYEELEPPGEEPPAQLLHDEPEAGDQQSPCQELPGSSSQEQPLGPGAPVKKSDAGQGPASAQVEQGVAPQQPGHTRPGEDAQEGPRGGPGSSQGAGVQCVCQKEEPGEGAVFEELLGQAAYAKVIHQDTSYLGQYQCLKCGKRFVYLNRLRAHIEGNTCAKYHECPTCGKKFRWKTPLTVHLVTHSTEREFSCELCGLRYKHKSSLVRHIKNHTQAEASSGSQRPKESVEIVGFLIRQPAVFTVACRESVVRVAGPVEKDPAS